jgi:hypothetical protein
MRRGGLTKATSGAADRPARYTGLKELRIFEWNRN